MRRSALAIYLEPEVIDKIMVEPFSEFGCFIGLFKRFPKATEATSQPTQSESN